MTDAMIAAGQRIMTGLAGTKTDRGFINAVKQYKIGNYILFSNNIESAAQLKTLCKELKDIAVSETGHIPSGGRARAAAAQKRYRYALRAGDCPKR